MPILLLALLAAEPSVPNANAANLAAMAPVIVPLPLPPADGAIEAAAVRRWRDDKAKDLRREGTIGGGNGGAPQP